MNKKRKILALIIVIILSTGMYFSNNLMKDDIHIRENENHVIQNNDNNFTIKCKIPNETPYMNIYSLKPFNFSLENCNETVDNFFPSFRNNSEIDTINSYNSIVYYKNNIRITVYKSGGIGYLVDPHYSVGNPTINESQAKNITYNFVTHHGNFTNDTYLNYTANWSMPRSNIFYFNRNISDYPIVGHRGNGIGVGLDSVTENVTTYMRLLREIGEPIENKKIISAKKAIDILNENWHRNAENITSIKLGYYVKGLHYEQLKMYPVWIFYTREDYYMGFYHCINAITSEVCLLG